MTTINFKKDNLKFWDACKKRIEYLGADHKMKRYLIIINHLIASDVLNGDIYLELFIDNLVINDMVVLK